jgi:hypothetical protein
MRSRGTARNNGAGRNPSCWAVFLSTRAACHNIFSSSTFFFITVL